MNLGTLSYPRKQVSPPSFRLIRGYEDQIGSRDVTRFHAGLFNTTERSPATDRFAPADFNETANTLGQALYAKQEPRKFDRGTDLHTQSNPLPMCHRPGVLIKLTAA